MGKPSSDAQWRRLGADIGRLVAGRLPARADVQDVVQEVLLRVWRHGHALRDQQRFGPWLSRIAYTAAADQLRARQRHPVARYAVDTDGPPEAADAGAQPDAKAQIATVLRPFVDSLPARYREAVALSELEGLPHAAVAARLGLSVSGVKSRIQRGRQQLRSMLQRCCEIALDARGAPVSCERRPDGELPAGCCAAGRGCSVSAPPP
jgi:RNA polymerase sigma-70 factor (ECF subfamily)